MITPAKLIVGILCATLVGFMFLGEALQVFAGRNAPIVTGKIIKREPIRQYTVPRADFTIRLEDNTTEVHAQVQRYLMTKTPELVRFHYSGDPAQEVFLFEHEENPYWIILFGWGVALFLTITFFKARTSARLRRILGWSR